MAIVKLEDVEFPLIIFAGLGIITFFVYCYFSATQENHHALYVILRFIFWVQIVFVTIKANEYINWDWDGALWPLWFVGGIVCIYSGGLFITLIFLSTMLCSKEVKKIQYIGLSWIFFASVGYGVAIVLCLVGLSDRVKVINGNLVNQDSEKYTMAGLIVGLGHTALVTLFSLKVKSSVVSFLFKGFESEFIT